MRDEDRTSRAPTEVDRQVGETLRNLRQARNMTLQELATHAGISHQQLQKYETGVNRLSAGMLSTLSGVLAVHVADFFEDEKVKRKGLSKTDALREQCQAVLKRTQSADTLQDMLKVLEALQRR